MRGVVYHDLAPFDLGLHLLLDLNELLPHPVRKQVIVRQDRPSVLRAFRLNEVEDQPFGLLYFSCSKRGLAREKRGIRGENERGKGKY